MAIYNLYSKRQKQLRGEMPDVYVYDTFPQALRVQLVQIIEDGIGRDDLSNKTYSEIHQILCREYGKFFLVDPYQLRNSSQPDWEAIKLTLLNTEDAEQIVDIVELCLFAIDHIYARGSIKRLGIDPVQMIDEVNSRFREHGVGYSFTAGKIIRVDSQLLHQEVVRPVLQFLADAKYSGANQEFLKAHEHYRHKRYKECLNECLKAFESAMKVICDTHGWTYDNKRDTAKALITICLSNDLIPSFQQNQLSHVTAILESAAPTVRNKLSGHGQGSSIQNVPEEMASFMLHITASNILLFIESEKRLSLSNNP